MPCLLSELVHEYSCKHKNTNLHFIFSVYLLLQLPFKRWQECVLWTIALLETHPITVHQGWSMSTTSKALEKLVTKFYSPLKGRKRKPSSWDTKCQEIEWLHALIRTMWFWSRRMATPPEPGSRSPYPRLYVEWKEITLRSWRLRVRLSDCVTDLREIPTFYIHIVFNKGEQNAAVIQLFMYPNVHKTTTTLILKKINKNNADFISSLYSRWTNFKQMFKRNLFLRVGIGPTKSWESDTNRRSKVLYI